MHTADQATRKTPGRSALPGGTSPSVSWRQRSTPCQRGVTYANHWIAVGSWEIGKKIPENRNIGRIAKRKMATKDVSSSVFAPQAASGAENASPTSTATGTARTASGDETAPKAVITTR